MTDIETITIKNNKNIFYCCGDIAGPPYTGILFATDKIEKIQDGLEEFRKTNIGKWPDDQHIFFITEDGSEIPLNIYLKSLNNISDRNQIKISRSKNNEYYCFYKKKRGLDWELLGRDSDLSYIINRVDELKTDPKYLTNDEDIFYADPNTKEKISTWKEYLEKKEYTRLGNPSLTIKQSILKANDHISDAYRYLYPKENVEQNIISTSPPFSVTGEITYNIKEEKYEAAKKMALTAYNSDPNSSIETAIDIFYKELTCTM